MLLSSSTSLVVCPVTDRGPDRGGACAFPPVTTVQPTASSPMPSNATARASPTRTIVMATTPLLANCLGVRTIGEMLSPVCPAVLQTRRMLFNFHLPSVYFSASLRYGMV